MRKENKFKNGTIKDILILLGSIALFSFAFRFWPAFLICAVIGFGILVKDSLRYITGKKQGNETEQAGQVCDETRIEPSKSDILYAKNIEKINELVKADYPNAVWVWKRPFQVRLALSENKEPFIVLNKAGGYRLAKVKTQNGEVVALEYVTVPEKPVQEKPKEQNLDVVAEDLPVNYELLAYSWVEAHVNELNARCNEAIGAGKKELILTSDDLPVQESWANCCAELMKAGLKDVEQIPDGIKIILLR